MFLFNEKPRSLIEQKKQQWAKEREELSKLSVPWGKQNSKSRENISSRSRQLSKFSNSEASLSREENYHNRTLPPINKRKVDKSQSGYDRYDLEGETSGYASDSAKEGTPEYYPSRPQEYQVWPSWNRGSDTETSTKEDRPRWDRGGANNLWESHEANEQKAAEPPGWLQRGLRRDKEVLVISHSPDSIDRPHTNESTNTHLGKTHLRGQNIPLDTTELAERERKREKAKELQTAIKQQLEERENKRKQERERRLREEAEEENRIRREQEVERLRVAEELRLLNEKKERERKRNQAVHEAIENAEREALQKKRRHKPVIPRIEPAEDRKEEVTPRAQAVVAEVPDIVKMKPAESQPCEMHNSESEPKVDPGGDGLTFVLPTQLDSLQGVQVALLLPTMNFQNTLPLMPIALSDRSITENRLLTPTYYRNKRYVRESSTQTDSYDFQAYDRYRKDDKCQSLDRRRDSNLSDRKERRMKSEDRSKERSERPKWGVNRPPTRYLKQSEKDPVYQKRKLRQKSQMKYDDKNNNYSQSSDDSVSETPDRLYRKPNVWQKNERLFSQNISVYQTEIMPLELDGQGRLYVKDKAERKELQYSGRSSKTLDASDEEKSAELLEKLNSLHNGLLLKQQRWEKSDNVRLRTDSVLPALADSS